MGNALLTHLYTKPGDYEVNLSIRDDDGGTATRRMTLSVPMSFADKWATIAEDAAVGTLVATVMPSQFGFAGEIAYEIVSGDDEGAFAIDDSGEIRTLRALDHEEVSFYNLEILGTLNGVSDTATVTVDVLDIDEPPVPKVHLSGDENGFVLEPGPSYDPEGLPVQKQWALAGHALLPAISDLVLDKETLEDIYRDFGPDVPLDLDVSDGQHVVRGNLRIVYENSQDPDPFVGNDPPPANGNPAPIPSQWEFWIPAYDKLNISGTKSSARVASVLASFNTWYPLTLIPATQYGAQAPAFREISKDLSLRVDVVPGGGDYLAHSPLLNLTNSAFVAKATAAEVARLNIRANLQSLKQDIVNRIVDMLVALPPLSAGPAFTPVEMTEAERVSYANRLADVYIRGVDEFLKTHHGARPQLGTRSKWLDLIGVQTAVNSPWCADWAQGMVEVMQTEVQSVPEMKSVFSYSWAAWEKSKLPLETTQVQHNWIAVYPARHNELENFTQQQLQGKPVLFLDPWWDLMPRVYAPGDKPTLLTTWNVPAPTP